MMLRRIPEWVRHAPTPGVRGFAVLSGIEATARGAVISVFPLVMYRHFPDAALVSQIYFLVGVSSLIAGLMIPSLTRLIPRRWMYTLGALLFPASALLAITGEPNALIAALLCNTIGTVCVFVCLNAYVLDYIAQLDLSRCETLRMFYSSLAWAVGPAGGVWLLQWWEPAPFLVSGGAALCLLAVFWWLRLGNGKLIAKARKPAPNPLAYLWRFAMQPRLVAGWLFAVLRSCAWWVYVVYVPIFCVQNGLGEKLGGYVLSITNAMLFSAPLMLRWMQRHSVRLAVRTGFLFGGLAFIAATLLAHWPISTVLMLMLGTVALILLDVCAGLPFLMAVKPSERTEMSAVYSSYRDVSGIVTPGAAALVLAFAPIHGIFAAGGVGLLIAFVIAGRLNPRLGTRKAPFTHSMPTVARSGTEIPVPASIAVGAGAVSGTSN